MMRRIVDGILPVCAAVATWPIALGVFPVPRSLGDFIGDEFGQLWCLTMSLSFTSISVGVAISKRYRSTAFWLQVVPLSYVGIWFTVFIFGIAGAYGLITAWQNIWWQLGIAGYFFARGIELTHALRVAKRLDLAPMEVVDPTSDPMSGGHP